MIKWNRTIVIAILLLTGCSGHNLSFDSNTATVTALAGSTIEHVSVVRKGTDLHLEVSEVDPAGTFFKITDLGTCVIVGQEWLERDGLLYLAEDTSEGIEVGLVPLEGYSGGGTSAEISLGRGQRAAASVPPQGFANTVQDLEVTPVAEGSYLLTWTEVNIGDYDANGLVGVSDLTPVGQHYGEKIGPDNAFYWVDGTRDGYILVDDITPIGQHYDSMIKGYIVWRNDEQVLSTEGGEITALRPDATSITGPPTYEVELEGEAGDSWYVTPVSKESPALMDVGQVSVTVVSQPYVSDADLDLEINFDSPAATFDVSYKSGNSINDGHQILRIIDPSDIVNNITIDQRLVIFDTGRIVVDGTGNTARVDQLPRGVPLFLEVIFAPEVDPSNAIPRLVHPEELVDGDDYFVVVAIPFELPEDLTVAASITADVSLVQRDTGPGYYVSADYEFTVNDDDGLTRRRVQRLDYPAGLVKQAADRDALVYAAALTDSDLDSVSDSLLESEQDEADYGEAFSENQFLRGDITTPFILEDGVLSMENVVLYPETGGELPIGSLTLYYNENTVFGNINLDEDELTDIIPIDPATILGGEDVRVRFYLYKYQAGDKDGKLWADIIALY